MQINSTEDLTVHKVADYLAEQMLATGKRFTEKLVLRSHCSGPVCLNLRSSLVYPSHFVSNQ